MTEVMNTTMLIAVCIINEPSCGEENSSKEFVMNTALHLTNFPIHTWR